MSGSKASAGPRPSKRPVAFAHPVESAFAGVLDEIGIRWLYEPHTFVLSRKADGAVASAFTPDFYLPDQDVYVECTVAAPRLIRSKYRKADVARRQYGIIVEIAARSDLERMSARWSLAGLQQALHDSIHHSR